MSSQSKLTARLSGLPGMSSAVPFMAAAVLMLPMIGLGLALTGGRIGAGETRGYPVLAVNHLITLGWGTLAAMGSLHQLFPAMIGVPLRLGREVRLQFGLSLIGALLLVAGFLLHGVAVIAAGGMLAWVGAALFVALILRLVPRRRRWLPACTGVVLALVWLTVGVTWGLMMGVNFARPFWPRLPTYAGLGVHAAAGIGGWFVQLIVSVSYYLLPRFTGRRVLVAGRLPIILILLNAGVILFILQALEVWQLSARIGCVLLAAAGLLFAVDLAPMLRLTRRGQPDLTIHHWRVIWMQTCALAALGLAWAVGVPGLQGRSVAETAALLLLTGWITLAIMGQLYKVSPFLMWHYRFALGMSALDVPRLEAPYYPRTGIAPFYLTVAGSTLLAGGRILELPFLSAVGGSLLLGGGLTFASFMATSWLKARVQKEPT